MRKGQVIGLFGLLPAIVVAGAVLLIGSAIKPPRFTARAVFAVDWNSMPSVPNDDEAKKVRTEWRKQIIREVIQLPDSDAELADILERANALSNNQNTNNTIISNLKRSLRITLLNQTAECDQFSVEVQNSNTNFAQTAAHSVMQGTISKINGEAQTAGGLAALRSYANVEDVIQRKNGLREERLRLQDPGAPLPPRDVRQRLQEIDAELAKLGWDHTEAGFGVLGNLAGVFFTDAVKVVEEAHIVKRRNGNGIGILLTAVVLGCTAGIAGFATYRFASVKSTTPRTSSNGQPMITTPPPIPHQPRLIAPIQNLTPPVLPPPVPIQPRL